MTEIISTNHNLSGITESLDPNGVTGHDPLYLTKGSASWLQNIFDTSSQMSGNLPPGLGAVTNHLSHNISIFEFAIAGSQNGVTGLAAQTVDYSVDIVATDALLTLTVNTFSNVTNPWLVAIKVGFLGGAIIAGDKVGDQFETVMLGNQREFGELGENFVNLMTQSDGNTYHTPYLYLEDSDQWVVSLGEELPNVPTHIPDETLQQLNTIRDFRQQWDN